MYVVCNDHSYTPEGGCSTSIMAVCDTEDEATMLVSDLEEAELDKDENLYYYTYTGTAISPTSLPNTNLYNKEDRLESILTYHISNAVFSYRGSIARKHRYNFDVYDTLDMFTKITGFLKHSYIDKKMHQYMMLDIGLYVKIAIEQIRVT